MQAPGWLAQQAPAAPAAPAQNKPVSANLKVRIGTSTYMPDGRVLSASASDWPLKLNEPVVVYAAAGATICEPKPATLQEPATMPAPGWRLEITPVREGAGELEVRMQWRQLGLARKQDFGRLHVGPTTTLTQHAGERIVLDYTNGTQSGLFMFAKGYQRFALQPRLSKEGKLAVTPVPTPPNGCAAVGMSLEVGLEPAKTRALVEAELWLVRPNKDGTERSDRQVLRLPVGQPASRYFFDEARLVEAGISADALAKISGELSAIAVEDGKIRFRFNVMRRYGKNEGIDTSGTYRDLVAAPGEVLAFMLPQAPDTTQSPLSIRLRASVLR